MINPRLKLLFGGETNQGEQIQIQMEQIRKGGEISLSQFRNPPAGRKVGCRGGIEREATALLYTTRGGYRMCMCYFRAYSYGIG